MLNLKYNKNVNVKVILKYIDNLSRNVLFSITEYNWAYSYYNYNILMVYFF